MLREPRSRRVTLVVVAAALAAAAWTLAADADLGGRLRLLVRVWTLLGAGALAVAPPHLLVPDPQRAVLPLANPSPRRLLLRHLGRQTWLVCALAPSAFAIALADPGGWADALSVKLSAALLACATWAATALAAQLAFVGQSEAAQARQEEREDEDLTAGLTGLSGGAVPGLAATALAFLVGAAGAVGGAFLLQTQPLLAPLPALALVALLAWRLAARTSTYARRFYQTDALYAELFRSGGGGVEAREPVAFDAVYWAPPRLRALTTLTLRQLDRRLPLGRLVLAGHVVLWFLFGQDAPLVAVAAYLVALSVLKNAAVLLAAQPALAPPPFQLWLARPWAWTLARTLANLRWTPAWLLSLALVALFDDALAWNAVLAWTALDVLFAAVFAGLATLLREYKELRVVR